jgi:hypothetical protein
MTDFSFEKRKNFPFNPVLERSDFRLFCKRLSILVLPELSAYMDR